MQVLERRIRDRLHGTLTGIQRPLPSLFADQFESGFVLNITLATVRDRVASLEMRDFYAETTPGRALQLRVARMSCPRDCPQATEIFGVGETTAMMNYLDTLPGLQTALPVFGRATGPTRDRGPSVTRRPAGRCGTGWTQRHPLAAAKTSLHGIAMTGGTPFHSVSPSARLGGPYGPPPVKALRQCEGQRLPWRIDITRSHEKILRTVGEIGDRRSNRPCR